MKILAFGTSNNRNSINQTLAKYAAQIAEAELGAEVEILDIHAFEMPIFSPEREAELGQPELAKRFIEKIGNADAIIISHAEYNSNATPAWINLYAWASRITAKVFQGKPLLILGTSPGGRGASSVISIHAGLAPHHGADLRGTFSLPKFHENFDRGANLITDAEKQAELVALIKTLA